MFTVIVYFKLPDGMTREDILRGIDAEWEASDDALETPRDSQEAGPNQVPEAGKGKA